MTSAVWIGRSATSWCYSSGKRAYSTKKRALNARGVALAGGRVPALWVYKCPDCRKWHLTSRAPRRKIPS